MTLSRSFKRLARLALAGVAAGALLSGCAAPRPAAPGECVGPADFCNVFFGS